MPDIRLSDCYHIVSEQEEIVDIPGSDQEIRAKMAEAQEFLKALESGNLHIGQPLEGRTEAKIADLRRQIAMYQSILDKRRA